MLFAHFCSPEYSSKVAVATDCRCTQKRNLHVVPRPYPAVFATLSSFLPLYPNFLVYVYHVIHIMSTPMPFVSNTLEFEFYLQLPQLIKKQIEESMENKFKNDGSLREARMRKNML